MLSQRATLIKLNRSRISQEILSNSFDWTESIWRSSWPRFSSNSYHIQTPTISVWQKEVAATTREGHAGGLGVTRGLSYTAAVQSLYSTSCTLFTPLYTAEALSWHYTPGKLQRQQEIRLLQQSLSQRLNIYIYLQIIWCSRKRVKTIRSIILTH